MNIDDGLIKNGITPEIVSALIAKHEEKRGRYNLLTEYYLGRHRIFDRIKAGKNAANNKIMVNHAKYIADVSAAFFIGSPVTYSVSDGYDIEHIKADYFEQSIFGVDYELEKQAVICGHSVEYVCCNSASCPRSFVLPVSNTFIVYDDTVENNKLFGVYYTEKKRLDGTIARWTATVADSEWEYTYAGNSGFSTMQLINKKRHYFGAVPFIEYLNNGEKQGDFEQQISQIDAYNKLMSDRINDKEQFVDSFLLLLGIDIDSDQAKKLAVEKILCGEPDGRGEYLSKLLNEADTEVLKKALKEDIHSSSMVPDLTDEKFSGNIAGVALRYKILGFEQHVKAKEPLFAKGLRERLELYINYHSFKSGMPKIPLSAIGIEFHRNLPANELEISQMINNLTGIASEETLLARLPFVDDAKEEKALADKERAEKQKTAMETAAGYTQPRDYNIDEE